MIEASLTTYRGQIIDYTKGTPTSVEFDFAKIWSFKRKRGHMFTPRFLEFFHVHPRGFLELSETDVNCVWGMLAAFGEPIFFSILTFDTDDLLNLDISFKGFGCYKTAPWDTFTIHDLNQDQLSLLKELAYGSTKS